MIISRNVLRITQHGFAITERNIYPCKLYSQKFLCHQSILPETLVYRFYEFFGESPKYSRYVVSRVNTNVPHWQENEFFKSERGFCDIIKKLTLAEIMQIIISLKDCKYQWIDFKKAVRNIDKICCERINNVSIEDALKLNYSWVNLLGLQVNKLQYFPLSLYNLKNVLVSQHLSPQLVILIMFYAGFLRKNHEVKQIIPVALAQICPKENLDELSTLELMVVVNVAFKTATKINYPSFLNHFAGIVSENLRTFVSDPALFVTLIKTLRHNKFCDYGLLKKIEKCCSGDKNILSRYNFTAKVHLLALYADALYGEHEFLSYLIDLITKNMLRSGSYRPYEEKSKNSIAGSVRAKDLARLLWAASYLGFKINPEIVEKKVIPIILEKALNGLYDKRLEVLIDSVLSLWIMGYKPVELLPFVFSKETIKYLSESKRIRYNFRLQLLITCVSIESPEAIKDVSAENWPTATWFVAEEKDMLKSRPNLLDVLLVVKSIAWRYGVFEVKCEKALPNLYLPGILLTTGDCQNRSYLHIEVLDESNCLYKTDLPNGLMLLKLRLLRQLGRQVILVNYKEHRNNHSSLIKFLEDEINKNR